MDVDFLIIGQGLAGSTLAVELLKRGQRLLVVDRQDAGSSSRVAAGLVTPLTGKGLNPAWRQERYLPAAERFYRQLENESGEQLYHATDVIRLLGSEKERIKWLSKAEAHQRWGNDADLSQCPLKSEHGAIAMHEGAWLDTRKFLDVVRSRLTENDSWREDDFNEADVQFSDEEVRWKDVVAKKIILCQGAYGLGQGGWFGDIPHRSAKGEILTLKIEGLSEDTRYHANGWIAPRNDGSWKAGATYDWNQLDSEPTEKGRAEVLSKLETWCDLPKEVVGHEAGVRPIIRNSRPVIGFHSDYKQLGFFNGLGSKGSLMAPAVAAHFAEVLTGEAEIDAELVIPAQQKSQNQITGSLIHTAHQLVTEVVRLGDLVVDATVGNGHDTLFLATIVGSDGKVIGFDIQQEAIDSARVRLLEAGIPAEGVQLHVRSHDEMREVVADEVAAIMFNLGYLPGADKSLITKTDSSLRALEQSVELLKSGGLLTIMCYPGHAGGDTEAAAVKKWVSALPVEKFNVQHYVREGSRASTPFLLTVHKK
ncbi:hypothetical protein NT6N_40510 [Oceaniferula spumae]|uniref:FAD dependent oxidoreductase domain-containing protein n=1 Tax=Oceaniferula spumae TaxID=2979115 RepID=A0AAT9FSJ3_9BACT